MSSVTYDKKSVIVIFFISLPQHQSLTCTYLEESKTS